VDEGCAENTDRAISNPIRPWITQRAITVWRGALSPGSVLSPLGRNLTAIKTPMTTVTYVPADGYLRTFGTTLSHCGRSVGSIYGWFTEGFDTPDLKEAKALLDQIS
jgi:hypothetical protein